MKLINGRELVSFSEYARRTGITRQRVGQLVAAGKIPTLEIVDDGVAVRMIDPVAADAARQAGRDPAQVQKAKGAAPAADDDPRPPVEAVPDAPSPNTARRVSPHGAATDAGTPGVAVPLGGSFAAARTTTETLRARRMELELRRESGELVQKADVVRGVFDAATVIVKILDAVPDALAGVLAAESDPRRVRQILADEVATVRTEIAAQVQQLAMAREPAGA